MRALGFSEVKKADVARMVREYDPNQTGLIEFEDYIDLSQLTSDS
jgi:Ca2+-binding EF-hand superfamily protein